MKISELVRALAAAGAAPEAIAIAVEAVEAAAGEAAAFRSKGAERQKRFRERHSDVTRDVTDNTQSNVTVSPPCPPIDNKTLTPGSTPSISVEREREQASFDLFWRAWPHKVGKPVAARSFAKVASELDAILAGLERYVREKPPDRPWLNPATFLNQRRWEDAPAKTEPFDDRRGSGKPTVQAVARSFQERAREGSLDFGERPRLEVFTGGSR